MIDPFANNPGYGVRQLTRGILKIPNTYGLLNQIGLFTPEPITQRLFMVESMNGMLNLLPALPPGSPGTVGGAAKRDLRPFSTLHIPHDDVVMPEEVDGVRSFDSEDAAETVAGKIAEKLATMRSKHAITLEYLRMGALKGLIKNSDGTTLHNLYNEFGIGAKDIDFALNNGATDVLGKVLEMKRWFEDHLLGETMTSILVLCSAEFIDALTGHAKVVDSFKYYQTNNQNLAGDYRLGFNFGGGAGTPVLFREYRGTCPDEGGVARPFIAAKEAHAIPLGTQNTFRTVFSPADFNEAVNAPGLELYAKMEPRKFGRGWDLHTQSNPLPICKRPELLVRLHTP